MPNSNWPQLLLRERDPENLARKKAIKAAGSGLKNSNGITVPTHSTDGAVLVGFVPDVKPKRFNMPNPINYAKWALKKYNRMCADIEIGTDLPEWPFPISVKELSRRVINQQRKQVRARYLAMMKQAEDVDAGIKNASERKVFDCIERPRTGGYSAIIRRGSIAICRLTEMVDADIEAQEVERIVR